MSDTRNSEADAIENERLTVGEPAPAFELMNQDRAVIRLSDLRGKKVLLLFYPADFSPVCTQEHCTFGPEIGRISGSDDTVVFGVSTDSTACHAAYRKQYHIPYDLLADPTRRMVKAYGMFAGLEPYNCGKRGTVVIDREGQVAMYEVVDGREVRSVDNLTQKVAGIP